MQSQPKSTFGHHYQPRYDSLLSHVPSFSSAFPVEGTYCRMYASNTWMPSAVNSGHCATCSRNARTVASLTYPLSIKKQITIFKQNSPQACVQFEPSVDFMRMSNWTGLPFTHRAPYGACHPVLFQTVFHLQCTLSSFYQRPGSFSTSTRIALGGLALRFVISLLRTHVSR